MPQKGGNGKKKQKNTKNIKQGINKTSKVVLTKGKINFEQEHAGIENVPLYYAVVEKVYSGDRLQVTYFDGDKTNLVDVHISKNLRRAKPKKGRYLMIQPRPFNEDQYDAVVFYDDNEVKKLFKWGEISNPKSGGPIKFEMVTKEEPREIQQLSKEDKKNLRQLRNKDRSNKDDYMDNIFNIEPNKNSIFHKFAEQDELVKDVLNFKESIEDSNSSSDSDIEINVIDEYISESDENNNDEELTEYSNSSSDIEINGIDEYISESDENNNDEDNDFENNN